MLWVRNALAIGTAPGAVAWVCTLTCAEVPTPWQNSKAICPWVSSQQVSREKLQRGHRWLTLRKAILTEPYLT